MNIFESEDGPGVVGSYQQAAGGFRILPDYIYRIIRVEISSGATCEILNSNDFKKAITATSLLAPNLQRPVINIQNNIMKAAAESNGNFITPTNVYYYKKPETVQLGYYVINDKALHDSSTNKTTNFELHPSEETELVYKILKFAGLSMRRDDVVRSAQSLEAMQSQQEKL